MVTGIGYLVNQQDGLHGTRGAYYDYVLAANGILIEAEGPYLSARVLVASPNQPVRGLQPMKEEVNLALGRIGRHLWDLALNLMLADARREMYLAFTVEDGEYRLRLPKQEASGASVKYETLPNTVLELHSHGVMPAFFSGTDNHDEQGLRLYGVVGNLDKMPQVLFRAGVYGHFHILRWHEVFEGDLKTAIDLSQAPQEVAV